MPVGYFTRKFRMPILPIGPSISYIPLTKGQYSLVDADDAIRLEGRDWSACVSGEGFYAIHSAAWGNRTRKTSLHRFVLGYSGPMVVDHINGDGLDNRRCNLRISSHAENSRNRKKNSNNTSGFKGVSLKQGKWQASIMAGGKLYYLGRFSTPEAAHAAYCEAAKNHHGEFARVA